MRKVLLLFIMLFSSFSLNSNGKGLNEYEVITTIEVILPIVVEIIETPLNFGLDNKRDMVSFIKYIKTQSETLTPGKCREDVYFVIQTIYNRMRHKKCTWRQYYNSQALNNSRSIKMLKSGAIKQYFNWNSEHDIELYDIAYNCNIDYINDSLKLPRDVLYFESFKNPPNRGAHLMKNFYIQRRHRFYRHNKIKKV